MDDRTKLQSDASEYGSPGDRERASEQADDIQAVQRKAVEPGGLEGDAETAEAPERVDSIGLPIPPDEERPVSNAEAAPHHDQLETRPAERAIGRDVRSQSQNGMGITR